jgi:ribonuclease HII
MLKLTLHKHLIECGTDEAGRGCLAGPVTAAAVILPSDFKNEMLTDSKQVSERKREILKPIIQEQAIAYAFAHIMMEEIEEINILNASILGMHRSIEGVISLLAPASEAGLGEQDQPQHILVDGNSFKPFRDIPHTCVIKGDGKYLPIAAASIIAKTERDNFMKRIHEEYPMYNWAQNKGYPTKEHRNAIRKYGITKYHRRSFRLLPEQYELDFSTAALLKKS